MLLGIEEILEGVVIGWVGWFLGSFVLCSLLLVLLLLFLTSP